MGENSAGDPITDAELPAWADAFGLTHPVLADPEFETTLVYMLDFPISLPARHLVGPGAVIRNIDGRIDNDAIRDIVLGVK